MANMREIKLRMKGIKDTRQITKAMKLISAAKLKRARQNLDSSLPYFNKVKDTIASILMHSEDISSPYFYNCKAYDSVGKVEEPAHENKKTGLLIISGDKGLAGGYNHNLLKLAETCVKKAASPEVFMVGTMGEQDFKRKGFTLTENFEYRVEDPTIQRAWEISSRLLEGYDAGELDEVYLIYTHMYSTIKQQPLSMKLLPLDTEEMSTGSYKKPAEKRDSVLYFEPSADAVIGVLVHKYLKGVIYGAMVQAYTSELSARMTAMDNATSNADEMLSKLELTYNRARQASITQEISEIVGGADALK